jgi:3',5'-cyclic AMP phosphodiesterase CpdA
MIIGASAMLYGRQAISMLTHRKGAPTETAPVPPFPADAEPTLRIAAVGDVGEGEEEEWQTAYAMHMLEADNPPYDALLLLGDNVYPTGDPARLDATVFHPFGILLEDGTALLAILGNHDVMGGRGLEQIRDLGMPGRWWSTARGDVLLIGLDSNSLDDPAQLSFLEDTLRDADEPWRIVAIHESPYSAGYQGSNLTVRDEYAPIFERYGVQLVLSGHDHDYQRSVPIDGVIYVVTGAGGRTRGTGEDWFTAASWSVLSYVDLNVFDDHLLVRAIDQDGRMFDEVTITRSPA